MTTGSWLVQVRLAQTTGVRMCISGEDATEAEDKASVYLHLDGEPWKQSIPEGGVREELVVRLLTFLNLGGCLPSLFLKSVWNVHNIYVGVDCAQRSYASAARRPAAEAEHTRGRRARRAGGALAETFAEVCFSTGRACHALAKVSDCRL